MPSRRLPEPRSLSPWRLRAHRSAALGLAGLNAALVIGCIPPEKQWHTGTAVEVPDAHAPRMEVAEPPPGTTSVLLDAVDGPAVVTLVRTRTSGPMPDAFDESGQLCVTPCAVSLPPGRFTLRFSRDDESHPDDAVVVTVRDRPILYRRALPTRGPGSPGFLALGYGIYTVAGWSFWLSLGATAFDEDREARDWAFVASSAVVALLGMWIMDRSTDVVHPGRGATFRL